MASVVFVVAQGPCACSLRLCILFERCGFDILMPDILTWMLIQLMHVVREMGMHTTL